MVDLHMHSTASDGTDSPEVIITKCAKLNLRLCSITDHDNIDSQLQAKETAAKYGLKYVSGVEFSVSHEGELHILGYGVNIENRAFCSMMEELRQSRVERVHEILRQLALHQVHVSFADVERLAQGNTLGRPHVALALMEKGYAGDFAEAFNKYLNENGLCYVKRRKLSAVQAIELILSAGGAPVLAHPKFVRTNDIDALVGGMAKEGLAGIEAYYPAHSDYEVEKYLRIAKQNGLIVTAGSDYHGKMREHTAIACEKRTGEALEQSIKFLTEKYAG